MLGLTLGIGIPLGYLGAWTLTARTLYRRYHLIEGEKRYCPNRASKPDLHGSGGGDLVCLGCARTNRQWWQSAGTDTTARGLSDVRLAWDCIIQSFIPPLTLTVYAMFVLVTAHPPLSPRELQARDKEQARRIEELEAVNRRLSDKL